ncbi:MAG: methyltransferase [Porticoccaceae bacterium]
MENYHSLLLNAAGSSAAPQLLVADENCIDFPFGALADHVEVLSNRHDVATRASRAGLHSVFSDFDFGPWQARPPARILYRLSKEKAVVHHIANQSRRLLAAGGELLIAGGKQEGIKTFAKTIGALFGAPARLDKHGNQYLLTARASAAEQTGEDALDDREYDRLREISTLHDKPVFSKPGMFGWDKVDAGSALLAHYLPDFLAGAEGGATLLDLGCGYGYLSLAASSLRNFHITATDNCAAALLACEHNFKAHGIAGRVVADDCAAAIAGPFQIILCNPPFHQGFQHDRGLTEKFLASTRRLLAPGGRALFVVNAFVPLEQLARNRFLHVETVLHSGSFKLVSLS